MQDRFEQLTNHVLSQLRGDEDATLSMNAEQSTFVRFNHGRVRQPGDVQQAHVGLRLIRGQRHASIELSVGADDDHERLSEAVTTLRAAVDQLPEDPHLLWSERSDRTEHVQPGTPSDPQAVVDDIVSAAEGLDLVGILAMGTVQAGFASSRGQRDWDQRHGVLFDWALYHQGDKAVKSTFGDATWDQDGFARRMQTARAKLEALARPQQTVSPGRHRVWLTPAAVGELLEQVSWGGFSLRAHRTHTTPLLRLAQGADSLDPAVQLAEDTAHGMGPGFTSDGFHKPERVDLVREGTLGDLLVSPRSQREYGVPTTGAGDDEAPSALSMGTGEVPDDEVLQRLGTGLYVSNLWYLNWSDRPNGRVTGMTRFATLRIEDGKATGPAEVMRFDDTLYHLLGRGLEGVGQTAELLPSTDTYGRRSTDSQRVPGVLVDGVRFTL